MANEQNLIPQAHKLSVEEQSKGGKASGKARREKADFIKTAKALLNLELDDTNKKLVQTKFKGLEDNETTYRTLVLIKQLEKALKGDINSAKLLIDVTGEKPKENIDAEVKLPIFNIMEKKTNEIEKEFEKYK